MCPFQEFWCFRLAFYNSFYTCRVLHTLIYIFFSGFRFVIVFGIGFMFLGFERLSLSWCFELLGYWRMVLYCIYYYIILLLYTYIYIYIIYYYYYILLYYTHILIYIIILYSPFSHHPLSLLLQSLSFPLPSFILYVSVFIVRYLYPLPLFFCSSPLNFLFHPHSFNLFRLKESHSYLIPLISSFISIPFFCFLSSHPILYLLYFSGCTLGICVYLILHVYLSIFLSLNC